MRKVKPESIGRTSRLPGCLHQTAKHGPSRRLEREPAASRRLETTKRPPRPSRKDGGPSQEMAASKADMTQKSAKTAAKQSRVRQRGPVDVPNCPTLPKKVSASGIIRRPWSRRSTHALMASIVNITIKMGARNSSAPCGHITST